jgi:hypothetical protein
MTEPTEQLLRDTLDADARRAPVPTDLVSGAVTRARQQRHRRAAVVGSTLAVLALVGSAALWTARPYGAAPHPGDVAAPTVGERPQGPVLQFRGVFVPVPAEMLDPQARRCGTTLKDAAYVSGDGEIVETCLALSAHPERLTEVVLEPTGVASIAENPSTSVLEDGRTQVLAYVLDRQLRLRVTSPDGERAAELAAGMRVVDSPDGCSVTEPTRGVPAPDAAPMIDDSLVPPGSSVATVCGYRNGWLSESAVPSDQQGRRIAEDLAQTPPAVSVPPVCDVGDGGTSGPDFWLVTMAASGEPASRVWVYGGACSKVINSHGTVHGLTDALSSDLWAVASGPFWMSGG